MHKHDDSAPRNWNERLRFWQDADATVTLHDRDGYHTLQGRTASGQPFMETDDPEMKVVALIEALRRQ